MCGGSASEQKCRYYNPVTTAWVDYRDMPVARSGQFGYAAHSAMGLVMAGGNTARVDAYNGADFSQLPDLPAQMSGNSLIAVDSTKYAMMCTTYSKLIDSLPLQCKHGEYAVVVI